LRLALELLHLMLELLQLSLRVESRLDLVIDFLLVYFPDLFGTDELLFVIDISDALLDVPVRQEYTHQHMLDLLLVFLVHNLFFFDELFVRLLGCLQLALELFNLGLETCDLLGLA